MAVKNVDSNKKFCFLKDEKPPILGNVNIVIPKVNAASSYCSLGSLQN
jgi:hypothetical protein